jgi:hypothetical protein
MRLSAIDSEAEAALRVIAAFDALVQHHASAEALVRTTAALAECPAGLDDPQCGPAVRSGADGRVLEGTSAAVPERLRADIQADGELVGLVWLEREGDVAGPYDELILERFSLAASALRRPVGLERDPAMVEAAVSADADDIQRSIALRRLGLDPGSRVRAVAFAGVDPGDYTPSANVHAAVRAAAGADRSARSAILGRVGVILQDARSTLPQPVAGAVLGVGPETPALEVAWSWRGAQAALRLGQVLPLLVGPVADCADNGALVALAHVPADGVALDDDVSRLRAHIATGLDEDLVALEAFLARGSLRGAGELLHRHHSSVATRLARVEGALGVDLSSAPGLFRAQAALVLVRLHP